MFKAPKLQFVKIQPRLFFPTYGIFISPAQPRVVAADRPVKRRAGARVYTQFRRDYTQPAASRQETAHFETLISGQIRHKL